MTTPLSSEQKKAVASWLAAGASIADVQKRLREEFQVSLTYIDTRLLIDDLGLDVKSRPSQQPAADLGSGAGGSGGRAGSGAPGTAPEGDLLEEPESLGGEEGGELSDLDQAAPASGKVTVDIDRITRPGTVVSGSVTFSDGRGGKWALDQLGRLIFEGNQPNYRPSQADLQEFQRELSVQLQRHGY